MPHITTYGGSYLSAQSEKDSFGSFEPRQAKLQEAFTNDQLTGVKGGQEGEEFSFTPVDTSTFEDRMPLDFDSSAVVISNGVVLDTQPPSAMHQGAMNSVQAMDEAGNLLDNAGNRTANIGGTAGLGGTSFMTGKTDFPADSLGGRVRPGGNDI